MANTTYFTFNEASPLNNPDNGENPIVGYVSSNKEVALLPGEGTPLADQVLPLSNCTSLSELSVNVRGRNILVSWLTRETVNEYGATKLPPKP